MGVDVRWEIKKVLCADDTVLVAETREHLQRIVNKFEKDGTG